MGVKLIALFGYLICMSLRAIAWQSRRMLSGYAMATGLPRRFTPRNDTVCSVSRSFFYSSTNTNLI
jgi:hypothetical protein